MRVRTIAVMIALLLVGSMLSAALIGAPAATVRLTKTTQISVAELEAEVNDYRESARLAGSDPTMVDPLQILNLLINNELFRQGAARDGVFISDQMVDAAFNAQKENLEISYGQRFTDEQFAQIIEGNFGSVAAYRNMIGEQLLVDAYVQMKKADELNQRIEIPERDVTNYYRKNQTSFISPETVKLSHIYIPFDENEAKNRENKALMEDVAQQLEWGVTRFEVAVVSYSQDTASKSKAGDIGWLTMDNEEALEGLGDEFFDVAFSTEVGTTSGVVTSKTGYHILKVLAYSPIKLLSLDDPISPNNDLTIRALIEEELGQTKRQEIYVKAINDMVADLRKSATVRILY